MTHLNVIQYSLHNSNTITSKRNIIFNITSHIHMIGYSVSEDMIKLRTEMKQGSEQSEKISGAKMTAFEKQIQLNSRLMVDEVRNRK